MALPQEVKLDYYAMEEPWTLQQNPYSAAPEGSPVDVAKEAMKLMLNAQCSKLKD
jgi:alpha-N-acetylglucosaminidase